mmetsp:Transcript_18364/g.45684  ORF Transcript_18364/g.45684 Transcript_18364/m.45684 type:complete len:266 (+) Transcript_18364:114-911(+)
MLGYVPRDSQGFGHACQWSPGPCSGHCDPVLIHGGLQCTTHLAKRRHWQSRCQRQRCWRPFGGERYRHCCRRNSRHIAEHLGDRAHVCHPCSSSAQQHQCVHTHPLRLVRRQPWGPQHSCADLGGVWRLLRCYCIRHARQQHWLAWRVAGWRCVRACCSCLLRWGEGPCGRCCPRLRSGGARRRAARRFSGFCMVCFYHQLLHRWPWGCPGNSPEYPGRGVGIAGLFGLHSRFACDFPPGERAEHRSACAGSNHLCLGALLCSSL